MGARLGARQSFSRMTCPARYNEPQIKIRARGWRWDRSCRAACTSRASRDAMAQLRPTSARSRWVTALISLGMVTVVSDAQCAAMGAKNPFTSLVLSMPQMIWVSRLGRVARVAAMARPAAGLCPPSSQISWPGRLSTSGPWRNRCMRAGQ